MIPGKNPIKAAWVSGSPVGTGVERAGRGFAGPLLARPDFRKIYFNKSTAHVEVHGPAGTEILPGQGFKRLGKTALLYSLKGKVPAADRYFLDSQNLAFLRLPRACIIVHDLFYLTHPTSRLETWQGRFVYGGLRGYEAVMAASHYSKSCLVNLLGVDPDRIKVFHLSCDQEIFRPAPVDRERLLAGHGVDAKAKVLFHLSSGERRKNFPMLLAAIKLLVRDIPELVLLKAGKDLHPRDRLAAEALVAELGLTKQVRFIGSVDDVRLAELYRACDCFAYPSLAEGFGLPVLEAQACGAPVVTSNVTSLPEISGPLCRAVDPKDVRALAEALRLTLEDGDMRTRLEAANREWMARFSWEPGRAFVKRFLGLDDAGG